MRNRAITTDDILYLMFWGDVVFVKAGKNPHDWKCKIKGKSVDGDALTFVAVINEPNYTVACVTVF